MFITHFCHFLPLFTPCWAQRLLRSDSSESVVELVLWIVIFIAALILGVLYLKKLRKDAKEGAFTSQENDIMSQFEEYYKQKLISFDEFQMIRKNLRDQLVYDVYQADKREKENTKKRRSRQPVFDESEKERRLKSLLKGLEDRK